MNITLDEDMGCDDFFDADTVELFGKDYECFMLDDEKTIEVIIGNEAALKVGDNLTLKSETYKLSKETFVPDYLEGDDL